MSTAKVTLIGLYNYYPHLFDKLNMPAGIDVTLVRDNILIRSGEFESLYSNPEFIRDAIGLWSSKWALTFEKWYEAITSEYDPISNYDRKEEWTTDTSGTQHSISAGNTQSDTGTIDNVSAYNSNTLVPDRSASADVTTSNSNVVNGGHDDTEKRTGRAWGNIGVTTSQQMLKSSLDLYEWNLYEHITDIFLAEFVIPVF